MAGVEVVEWGRSFATGPALTAAGEVYRLIQNTSFGNQVACLNVWYFATDTTGNAASTLVNDWVLNVVPTWKNQVTNNMIFKEITAQRVYPSESPLASSTLTGAGALSVVTAPVNSAGVITWRTAYPGRNRRGRTYIAGLEYSVPTTSNTLVWQNTGLTRLTTLANTILTRYTLGGNPGGFYLIVWSRKLYTDNPASWPNAAAAVNRFTIQPYIASMGTRRFGRGM